MTLPTLGVLCVFAAIVFSIVRADRLADFDATLASHATGLAGLVERDWGQWEMHPPDPEALAGLTGVRIEALDGTAIFDAGPPSGRVWTREFRVDEEGEAEGLPIIRVSAGASTEAMDAGMRRLAFVLAGAGLGLAAVSVATGLVLAQRIVSAEALTALQERFDQQARFTADASHELRTPLAAIRTEVDVALRRDRTADQYRATLLGVRVSAERMTGILDGLLFLARADAGELLEAEDVDLHALASDVCGGVPVSGTAALVRGDPRLLGILVRNLVSNALRHTPSGAVRVETRRDGDWAVLTVTDEGEGIPAAALPRVRERFYRVDSARARESGGAGLGLSIVDTSVRLHHGTWDIASVVGRGTTVTVRLPSAPVQPVG